MRRNLFAKAKYLAEHTKLISETNHSIRLKVGNKGFEVEVKYKNHAIIFSCTCDAGSLSKPCAHILASISCLNNGITKKTG